MRTFITAALTTLTATTTAADMIAPDGMDQFTWVETHCAPVLSEARYANDDIDLIRATGKAFKFQGHFHNIAGPVTADEATERAARKAMSIAELTGANADISTLEAVTECANAYEALAMEALADELD